jgi:hypothetical protein
MRVKVVVPVWGSDYINTFINISLATQLSEKNLPLIAKKHEVEYVIYTLKSDVSFFENSESVKLLRKFTSVRFELIRKFKIKNTYRLYGQIHFRELKKSSKFDESVFLINSDFVFSDGFFSQTLKEIRKSTRVVNIVCPRANLESVSSILQTKFSDSKHTIKVNSNNLTSIYLRNIHKMMDYHMLPKAPSEEFLPSSLMWKARNGSLFIRNFHFHPVLIYPNKIKLKKIKNTIDDGYVYDNFNKSEIYIQKEYNKHLAIELSKESNHYKPVGKYNDYLNLFFYFFAQIKSNFINYNSEIVIGKIAKKELDNFRLESEKEITRVVTNYLYITRKYNRLIRFHVLIKAYWFFAAYFSNKKAYFPDFIIKILLAMHEFLVVKIFKVKNQS